LNFLSEYLILHSIIKIRTQAGNQSFNDSLLYEESLFSSDQTAVAFPLYKLNWTVLGLSCLAAATSPSKVFSGMQDRKAQRIKVMSCFYDTLFKLRGLLSVVCDKMKKKFQN